MGNNALKAQFKYMKAVEVAGLSKMIDVLGVVIGKLLALLTGNFMATPSLVLLIKEFDTQNPAHMAAGLTDVMVLWMLAVRAIGVTRSGATRTDFAPTLSVLLDSSMAFDRSATT